MQRQAWIYSMTATVLGALGVLVRWLQCQSAFEPETGLAIRGATVSYVMTAVLVAITALLWLLSGRLHTEGSPEEPEEAIVSPGRETKYVLYAAAAVAGVGAVWMFFTESNSMMRLTALLGLLSAPVLAMQFSLPRWGGFGAFLSVIPVVFFCLWLGAFFKENSVNPVLWQYMIQILAIAACLHAAFRLCGYLFYRIRARRAVFACALALSLGLTVLMDNAPIAARLMFAGWGVGFGLMCWVLVRNLRPAGDGEPEEAEEFTPAPPIPDEGLIRREEKEPEDIIP